MIDAYCHCGISRYLPVSNVLAAMEQSGVERAVLVQHLGEYDNSYLEEVVRGHALRFAGVALVDHESSRWPEALERISSSGAFKGLRLRTQVLEENPAIAEQALADGLVLVVSTWPGPDLEKSLALIRRLAESNPEARILIPHLGSPQVENGRLTGGRELVQLAELENVSVTLSGQPMFCEYPYKPLYELVEAIVAGFGLARIMWASNFPESIDADGYQRDLELLRSGSWPIPESAMEQVTHSNAERLWFA
jgi:predicted TIM-barrel fold metal-dependent hydrolase